VYSERVEKQSSSLLPGKSSHDSEHTKHSLLGVCFIYGMARLLSHSARDCLRISCDTRVAACRMAGGKGTYIMENLLVFSGVASTAGNLSSTRVLTTLENLY
jgi:hypothetical protein